jgi:hypothetical protein
MKDRGVTDQGLGVSEGAGMVAPAAEKIDMGSIEKVAGETDHEDQTTKSIPRDRGPDGPGGRRCGRCGRESGGWIDPTRRPRMGTEGGRHDIDAARVTGREAETWRAR